MHHHLRAFVDAHTVRVPSASYPVKQFVSDFLASIPEKARGSWRRGRVISGLVAAGFPVALGDGGVFVVGGLAPKGQLREVDGRMELSRG